MQRAVIHKLLDHLYLIDDANESTCYVICGSECAMVIDTANGRENLLDVVRSITPLPLIVVNTHGHCDHIYGNVFFDEAWMHAEDHALSREHFGFAQEWMQPLGLRPCPVRSLEIGHVFDLGGLKLEVISLRGHTPGSIGLLDRQDRILFSGDGLNTHLWMQLDNSSSIAQLRQTLADLKQKHGHAFDYVLTGHDKGFREKAILDLVLAGCDELLHSKREKDTPYHYFGGECLQHPLGDIPGQCIVYSEDKL